MSIGRFSLAEASIVQGAATNEKVSKAPPKRQAVAIADRQLAPEPR